MAIVKNESSFFNILLRLPKSFNLVILMQYVIRNLITLIFFFCISFLICAQKHSTTDDLSFKALKNYILSDTLSDNESLKYAITYIKKARDIDNPSELVNGYYFAGLLSADKEKVAYADSILMWSVQTSDHRNEDALIFKGSESYKNADYQTALDYYIEALVFAKKNNEKKKLFFLEYNIGTLQSIAGEYRKSLDKFLKSYAYINPEKEDKKTVYLTIVSALATTYGKLGILDSASYYTKIGIQESRNNSNLLDKYEIFVLKEGIIQYYKKNYGNASDSIQKTIPYLERVKDTGNLAYAYFYKGKIFDVERKEEQSLEQFKKLDTLFFESPVFFPEAREAYEILIHHYRSKNELKKQLYYTERLLAMDSMMYHKNAYVSKKITEAYDTPRLLEDKQRLIRMLTKKSSVYKYILIVAVFLIAIISAFLMVYYRKQRQLKKHFEALLKENKSLASSSYNISLERSSEINIPKEIVERVLEQVDDFKKSKGFLSPNLTLQLMAKNLKTNHSYLSKIINIYESKSFSTFLNELRIDYAIERLQVDTIFIKYTIDAIAQESGFSNTRSFTRAFKRKTNINPSYFIKNLKEQQIGLHQVKTA